MLNAQPEQFTLNDEGHILFQEKPGNPVPGTPVAQLEKGDSPLNPNLIVTKDDEDQEKVQQKLQLWLNTFISETLQPLTALSADVALDNPVANIGEAVFNNMGVVPRADIEADIAKLDEQTRATVRAKKIRLGPILVFQPDMNKPAALRLRALLWSLYNDQPLPAPVPKDGVVSYNVDGDINETFYQTIGYPIYGGRAIRIDMLDRVVNAVYEGADKGKFKAEHKMAEWLGSSIEDLYKVLEALGHKKIYDPADKADKAETQNAQEKPVETPEEELATEKSAEAAKTQDQEKPELATFALKKGKANQKGGASKPKSGSKPKKDKKRGKRNKSTNKQPKVMSAEAKTQDENPFAVLEALKKGNG